MVREENVRPPPRRLPECRQSSENGSVKMRAGE